jgi:hypothetical protein
VNLNNKWGSLLLKNNTVFVIGAGASKEYDLPVGTELAIAISDKLDVRFDDFGQKPISGDIDLFRNVSKDRDAGATQQAGWLIRDGIILANSIDDFLDVHRHDEEVVRYGKAAIVKCILEAERSSKLHYDQSKPGASINFRGCADTWLVKLMRRLASKIPHSDRAKLFDKCGFVVFNYDRCIEHFFINALQRLYNIGLDEAQQIVRSAKIYHAYGDVGTPSSVPFGTSRIDYCRVGASSIKTYTETVESDHIRELIISAEQIVFLGMAYHEQNLRILAKPDTLQIKSIIGTAYHRSASDVKEITNQIAAWAGPDYRNTQRNHIQLANDFPANRIFDDYSTTL